MRFPKVKLLVGNERLIARIIFNLINFVPLSQYRKFVFGMPYSLARKVKRVKEFKEVKEELLNFVRENNDKISLAQKTKALQSIWNKLNDQYFMHLKRVMEINTFKQNLFLGYTTYVVASNYDKKNNRFVVQVLDELKYSIYYIMEEVLHLVYWDIWDTIFDKKLRKSQNFVKEKNGLSVWKISETIPSYVFNLNIRKSSLGNYPWLLKARKILDPIWKERKNFVSFLVEAHKLCGIKPKSSFTLPKTHRCSEEEFNKFFSFLKKIKK